MPLMANTLLLLRTINDVYLSDIISYHNIAYYYL